MIRLCLVAMLLLAACGTGEPVMVDTSERAPATPDSTASPAPPPDLTVLIGAIDAGLAGTRYEGAALADPETFISTGRVICEKVDTGARVDQVLSAYLGALAEVETDDTDAERARVAGVVAGASLEVLCPEHLGAVTSAEAS